MPEPMPDKWIKTTDQREPPRPGPYWCTYRWQAGTVAEIGVWDGQKWQAVKTNGVEQEPLAWMELPEPWEAES